MVSHITHNEKSKSARIKTVNIQSSQHGSALIISMLILLVMTIIGLGTMNSSIMGEKMATNNQDMITTFQAATSANGGCIAGASPGDSRLFERFYNKIKSIKNKDRDLTPDTPVTPVFQSYALDPTTLTQGDCSARILRRTSHFNSSADLFVGYDLAFTGTGVITGTNSKTVNVQGAHKGPFPAQQF